MEERTIENRASAIGYLFLLTNQLQTKMDQYFETYKLTAKQWYLLAVLSRFKDEKPRLTTLASAMGTSYQNVKQLALKLEQGGFIEMKQDPADRRALNIHMSEKAHQFFEDNMAGEVKILGEVFEKVSTDELEAFVNVLSQMLENIASVDIHDLLKKEGA